MRPIFAVDDVVEVVVVVEEELRLIEVVVVEVEGRISRCGQKWFVCAFRKKSGNLGLALLGLAKAW